MMWHGERERISSKTSVSSVCARTEIVNVIGEHLQERAELFRVLSKMRHELQHLRRAPHHLEQHIQVRS